MNHQQYFTINFAASGNVQDPKASATTLSFMEQSQKNIDKLGMLFLHNWAKLLVANYLRQCVGKVISIHLVQQQQRQLLHKMVFQSQ